LSYDVQPPARTVQWLLEAQPAPGLPITLGWLSSAVPAERQMWLAELDSVGAPVAETFVDLSLAESLEIDHGSRVRLTATTDGRTERLDLGAGWNLVALGVIPDDPDPAAVFGTKATPGTCWSWQSGTRDASTYAPATGLTTQEGYWVHCPKAGAVLVAGVAAVDLERHFQAGWNLVGPGRRAALPSVPQIVGPVWWWDVQRAAYRSVQPGAVLEAGLGYWVYCAAPVTVDLVPAQ
jgi:hypothetical protein